MYDSNDIMRICKVSRCKAYEIMKRSGAIDLNKGTGKRPLWRINESSLQTITEPEKAKSPMHECKGLDRKGRLERRH